MKRYLMVCLLLGGGIAVGVFSTLLLRPAAVDQPVKMPPQSGSSQSSRSQQRTNPALPSHSQRAVETPRLAAASSQSPLPLGRPSPTPRSKSNTSNSIPPSTSGNYAARNIPAQSSAAPSTPTSFSAAPVVSGGGSAAGRSQSPLATGVPQTNETASPVNGEIAVPVPAGQVGPAVFYDQEERTPQQAAALDQIAAEFSENISNPIADVSAEENWNAARKIADERYLTLFGYQAYNQYHLQGAMEALKEKQATPAALPSPAP